MPAIIYDYAEIKRRMEELANPLSHVSLADLSAAIERTLAAFVREMARQNRVADQAFRAIEERRASILTPEGKAFMEKNNG